jgi:hypothetical protein
MDSSTTTLPGKGVNPEKPESDVRPELLAKSSEVGGEMCTAPDMSSTTPMKPFQMSLWFLRIKPVRR